MQSAPIPVLIPHDSTTINESVVIKQIVRYLELRRGTKVEITTLAQDFGIKRRGLYDFLSICATFGICRRYSSTHVEWFGIDQADTAINTLREQCRESNGHITLFDVFGSSNDPSLQRLSVAIIKLFFFLRVKFLDLRKVGRIFAQHITKYKTMLRKLYTVAGGLEVAGLIRKTRIGSEIQLVASLDADQHHAQLGLESILNSQEELDEEQTCQRRRREFEALCAQLSQGMAQRAITPSPIVRSWQ
jgi:hypothetical protein